MLAFSGIMTAYNMATMEHEHQEVQGLSYMKIRNKPFPWKECPNCDLLDSACWKECRDAKNN